MKKYQFEELTAALSIIIAVLAYHFDIMWLFYIYLVKSVWDTHCAIKEAKNHIKSKNANQARESSFELVVNIKSTGIKKPGYAKPGDAGIDLVATSFTDLGDQVVYGTDVYLEIPEGYVGLIYPRSSIFTKHLTLSNSVGVIDSGYRGEIRAIFNKKVNEGTYYQVGDKIAQIVIMPYPKVKFNVVCELSESDRGANGFGSTGK